MSGRVWRVVVVSGLLLAAARSAGAQANLQSWGNVTVDWVKSGRLAYELELDLEPKVLLGAPEGDPGWRNLDLTPNLEYSPRSWFDIVMETTIGRTVQTDDVETVEVTPRIGARFHLFSRSLRHHPLERAPTRRVVVRDLVRFEARNFYYRGSDADYSYSSRFRNRLEVLIPLNKERLTDDGARYVLTDWEWFIPLSDQEERYANKQRVRAGLGYRPSFTWRFEVLYIWTRSRDTIEDDFDTSDNIINIRVKRVF